MKDKKPAPLLEDEYPTHYLPNVGRQVMGSGGGIDYNVPLRLPIPGEDTEAMFRRLVEFSYAVGRQYRADGGDVEEPGAEASKFVQRELARPTAAEQAHINEVLRPSPMLDKYSGYGAHEAVEANMPRSMPTAHEFVQHQLKGNERQLPQMDRAAYQAMKEYSVLPLQMAAYSVPVAGEILGAVDLARGIHDVASAKDTFGRGVGAAEATMAATGVKGKLAKAAAAGMAALMPEEAQAGAVSKALEAARRLNPLGYYSPAAEAVSGIRQEKGRIGDFLNAIKGRPGVTAEELKHSGIESAFEPNATVSREEIADFLHNKLPQIQEKIYGGAPIVHKPREFSPEDVYGDDVPSWLTAHYELGPSNKRDQIYTIQEAGRGRGGPEYYLKGPKDDNLGDYSSLDEAIQAAHDAMAGRNPVKYGEYALPGGERYREITMQLPPSGSGSNRGFQSQHWSDPNVLAHLRMSDRSQTFPGEANLDIMRRMAEATGVAPDKLHTLGSGAPSAAVAKGLITPEEAAYISRAKGWSGSEYFDKPGIDKKILHLEELQSDWGQSGRDKGFSLGNDQLPEGYTVEEIPRYQYQGGPQIGSEFAVFDPSRTQVGFYAPTREEALRGAINGGNFGVPSGPYVTSTEGWTDLALKRALREAAEGGYNKMVWTPGSEHATRYNLAKHVNEVAYSPETKRLIARTHGGKDIGPQEKVEPGELSKHIGKEAAKRLLAQEPNNLGIHSLRGDDLQFGGHGMTEYYDKLVPNRLQKMLKKLGHEPSMELFSHELPTERGDIIKGHALHITPELRELIMRGLPAFRDGGEVEREHFEEGGMVDKALSFLSQFNPVGTAHAESPFGTIGKAIARAATKTRVPLEEAQRYVVSPFHSDEEAARRAAEIAESWRVPAGNEPKGGYYNVKQSRPVSEVTAQIGDIPGLRLKDVNPMSWQDFYDLAKGATVLNIGGDRINFGRMSGINGRRLAWDVDLHAGPKYGLEPSPGSIWANAPGPATGFKNAVREASRNGPVFGVYTPMGPQAVDSSHNMVDTLMAQIPGQLADKELTKKAAREFDAQLRAGKHAESAAKRDIRASEMADWPGLLNPKDASDFLRTVSGGGRRAVTQFMDKSQWRDAGLPMVGETRVAVTDPAVLRAPKSSMGHRIVQFDPENMTPSDVSFTHSTYSVPTGGRYVGDVPLLPRHYVMPTALERIMQTLAANGDVIHPLSVGPKGRDSARKFFEEQKLLQPVDENFLQSVLQGMDRKSKYGFRKGGTVISDALDVVFALPQDAEAETSA